MYINVYQYIYADHSSSKDFLTVGCFGTVCSTHPCQGYTFVSGIFTRWSWSFISLANSTHEMTSNDFRMAITYNNYSNHNNYYEYMSHEVILSPCCIILQVDILISSDSGTQAIALSQLAKRSPGSCPRLQSWHVVTRWETLRPGKLTKETSSRFLCFLQSLKVNKNSKDLKVRDVVIPGIFEKLYIFLTYVWGSSLNGFQIAIFVCLASVVSAWPAIT